MPFLRAARIRKNLQPEIERPGAILTPVVDEQTEPEEELAPVQIEDLHRLIDIRTKEAERAEEEIIVVVPEIIPDIETVFLEAESVQEISEEENEPAGPEITEPESDKEAEIETITNEADSESDIAESETESAPENLQADLSQEVSAEAITPENAQPDSAQETIAETVTPEADTEPELAESETESTPENLQTDSAQEISAEDVATESEIAPEDSQTESESSQEALTEAEIITPETEAESADETETVTTEPEAQEPEQESEISQSESESEAGILQDNSNTASADFDENSILDEPASNETPEPEQEIIIPEAEQESSQEESHEQEPEDSQPAISHKDYSGSQLDYDFTSGERYVDKVSTKTEFDKMLDELANISKELLSWQADKFARDYTGKFQEGESSQADARKYEAFLGGYITNAAMMLYDKGYRDAAIKQLEQAKSILEARKKLEDETSAIKSRVEEQNDVVDLSDILGIFGDA